MNKVFSTNIIVELLGFVIAFVFLHKDNDKVWKSQVLYLLIVVIAESSGRYMIKGVHYKNNSWIYNLLLIAETFSLTLMFNNILNAFYKGKLFFYLGLILFTIVYLLELIAHGFYIYNSNCDTVMSVYYCTCCFFYYYFLLKEDGFHQLYHLAPFWWVNGVLFFYFGNIICDLFFSKFSKMPDFYLRYNIIQALIIILYICWSYAFICKYQQRKLAQ